MRKLLLSILFTSTITVPATAGVTEDRSYTRFLVPLYQNEVTGALGSRWQVETWLYYSGDADSRPSVVPTPFCTFDSCTFGVELDSTVVGQPLPLQPRLAAAAGLLLHVESQHAKGFTFGSRVRDLSRQEDSAGTEIPVVGESQFSAQPVHLLNVPLAPHFRNMLRVYALPEVVDPEVEVRYYGMPDPFDLNADRNPLRTERVRLRTYPATQGFLIYPSLAEIAGIESSPELAGKTALWIDVVPVTAGLRVWAFVSVTNNDTQQVTVVSPMGQ